MRALWGGELGRTSPAAHTGRGLVLCDPLISLVFLPVPAKQPFNVANVPLRMLALKVCVCVCFKLTQMYSAHFLPFSLPSLTHAVF